MIRSGCLLAALLAAGLATACGSSTPENTPATSAATAPATKPAPPSELDNREAGGFVSVLSVEHEVDVAAQRDGVVVAISKDEGSRVRAGDVLGRLDDSTLQAERDKAKADLEVARYNVKYNEAELKARDAALNRQQQLRQAGLSSQADLEEAEFRAKGAEFDLQSWKAVVQRNEATVRGLDLEIQQTRIHAPFSGVVSRRYVRAGQSVAKDDKCFRVSQLGPLEVRFQVPENSSRQPRVGDTIQVAALDDSRRIYPARIQRVSPTVDAASGSYDVTARLTGENLKDLRPGMGVRVLWQSAPAAPRD